MNLRNTVVLGLLLGASFVLGQVLVPLQLQAQGRGPTNPPPPDPVIPAHPTGAAAPLVVPDDGGQSATANGFLAVTGSYGVGTSVLYLVDTVNRQLAVYEARGGSTEQRRIVLVGARKLDLDLRLVGYNDDSEYDYKRLRKLFETGHGNDSDVSTGLEPERGNGK